MVKIATELLAEAEEEKIEQATQALHGGTV
jgi:hypothetical protein